MWSFLSMCIIMITVDCETFVVKNFVVTHSDEIEHVIFLMTNKIRVVNYDTHVTGSS